MIAELFLIMDLLGDTVDTPISPSAKPQIFKKKERVIKGVKDVAGTAFGELKFKKFF
tara:strand:+ start:91 stop:261 length:171 start_codon:yes stop_codon:yes gene_type:complete